MLEVVSDSTYGWNRTGSVELAMPRSLLDREVADRKGYWVRCRYSVSPDDCPPRGVEQRGPDPYEKSPEITWLHARTVGGTVPASQSATIENELLGISDGTAGQEFVLLRSPVLRLEGEDHVMVGPIGDDPGDLGALLPWERVNDFSESTAEDRHFVCDNRTGSIRFGPALTQPDGSVRQYGAIPEKGMTVLMSSYRTGGGAKGNVRERKIRILKSALPYIAEVDNPKPAAGGRDMESLERAKLRALEVLKVRNRAVTAEDFEFLARKGCSGVGRARCVQPLEYGNRSEEVSPGKVKVLIVPALNEAIEVPRPADLRVPDRTVAEVRDYLDERRLLTTQVEIGEPDYLFVSTEIRLVADPRADEDQVTRRVRSALNRFVNPLWGGPNGEGWPFRRTLTLADLYAQVGEVRGVAFLLDAKIFVSKLVDLEQNVFGSDEMVSNAEGVRVGEHQILATREHRIRVVPMAAVGEEEAPAEVAG
jgi:predicted phage baseplate assembly protein